MSASALELEIRKITDAEAEAFEGFPGEGEAPGRWASALEVYFGGFTMPPLGLGAQEGRAAFLSTFAVPSLVTFDAALLAWVAAAGFAPAVTGAVQLALNPTGTTPAVVVSPASPPGVPALLAAPSSSAQVTAKLLAGHIDTWTRTGVITVSGVPQPWT